MADSHTLDRIDIRYSVRTRTIFDRPVGPVVVEGSFLVTLGTYSGVTDADVMALNINGRGIHPGDVEGVSAPVSCPSIDEAVDMLAARGIAAEDVMSIKIAAVLLDDEEIAEPFQRDEERP